MKKFLIAGLITICFLFLAYCGWSQKKETITHFKVDSGILDRGYGIEHIHDSLTVEFTIKDTSFHVIVNDITQNQVIRINVGKLLKRGFFVSKESGDTLLINIFSAKIEDSIKGSFSIITKKKTNTIASIGFGGSNNYVALKLSFIKPKEIKKTTK